MADSRIENLNILSETTIISPLELKAELPITEEIVNKVMEYQHTVKNILAGTDKRQLAVIGPCSIHDYDSAIAYAKKLKELADKVSDSIFVVMRVYFEKPRTTVGWQGFLTDPAIDGSYDIETGVRQARKLLLEISELGLPVAGEALDLITPQYIQDLISWTAIGARTVESQIHRKMVSGLTSAVGFKNATDGNVMLAINAMESAANPSHFKSINPDGKVAIIRTKGNKSTHIVLRGGGGKPNYSAAHVAEYEACLKSKKLPLKIMIDCSHANSNKDHRRQHLVLNDIIEQIENGNQSIFGFMLESNLVEGNQSIPCDLNDLKFGVSITDKCVGWDETEQIILSAAERLRKL